MGWLKDALFGSEKDREEDAIVQMFKPVYDRFRSGTQEESHGPDEYYCGICGWQSLKAPCEHLPIRR